MSDSQPGGTVNFWAPPDGGHWALIALVPYHVEPGPSPAHWIGLGYHNSYGELTPSKARELGTALVAAADEADRRWTQLGRS